MIVADIAAFLEKKAPADTAEPWDNVGLLIGGREEEVHTVLVCLDVTPAAVREAERVGAELLVSHHPVIFSPLKRLEPQSLPYQLAQKGLAAYAAHTNLDKAPGGVNDTLAGRLGLQDLEITGDGLCRIGRLPCPLEASAFVLLVAEHLGTTVRAAEGIRTISRVGVCGGAGGDEGLALFGQVDAFVTGEMKHHHWLAAGQAGITAVEAGHYATEGVVVPTLAAWLRDAFPELSVVEFEDQSPYITR